MRSPGLSFGATLMHLSPAAWPRDCCELFQTTPMHDGAVSLPAFLDHCARNGMPLTGHGVVAPAHVAFQEVKAAFRAMTAARPDAPEWELSAEDCAFVRKRFEYPKFDEYTYPSADLQLSASSFDAVNRGEYQWIVAELHPPVAILHHALYWSCPDKAALSAALAEHHLRATNCALWILCRRFYRSHHGSAV